MSFNLRPDRPPARFSKLRLLIVIVLAYSCVKVFSDAHLHRIRTQHRAAPVAPIVAATDIGDDAAPGFARYHFAGRRVWGNGTDIDLGDRRTHLPGSILSKFFPARMHLSSCLTEPVPSPAPPQKLLPVRDDWPGFYGAPWIARVNGNLIVLLDVYAPRNTAGLVPPPQFQIYTGYENAQIPAWSTSARARFYRGSNAVLYRVFLTGPVPEPARCLDLVVQNGQAIGTGHLYYLKYTHYYESDANFTIQR